MLTRSLWLPMGLHAAWNFTQGEIFDVPVSGLSEHGLLNAKLSGPALLSGGSFGLEASVICLDPRHCGGNVLCVARSAQGRGRSTVLGEAARPHFALGWAALVGVSGFRSNVSAALALPGSISVTIR